MAKWRMEEQMVQAEVWNKVGEGMWTSIGFSEDRTMVRERFCLRLSRKVEVILATSIFQPNSDLVVGHIDADGNGIVRDMWTLG